MKQEEINQLRRRLSAYEEKQQIILSTTIETPSQLSDRQKILFSSIVSSLNERQEKLQYVRNEIKQTLIRLTQATFDRQIEQTVDYLQTSINQSSEQLGNRIENVQTTLEGINKSALPNRRWWIQLAFIVFTFGSGVMTLLFLYLSNFGFEQVANCFLKGLATVFLVGCLLKVVIDTLRLFPKWKKRIQQLYGYDPPQQLPHNIQQVNHQSQQRLPPTAQNFAPNIEDNLGRDPNS